MKVGLEVRVQVAAVVISKAIAVLPNFAFLSHSFHVSAEELVKPALSVVAMKVLMMHIVVQGA